MSLSEIEEQIKRRQKRWAVRIWAITIVAVIIGVGWTVFSLTQVQELAEATTLLQHEQTVLKDTLQKIERNPVFHLLYQNDSVRNITALYEKERDNMQQTYERRMVMFRDSVIQNAPSIDSIVKRVDREKKDLQQQLERVQSDNRILQRKVTQLEKDTSKLNKTIIDIRKDFNTLRRNPGR